MGLSLQHSPVLSGVLGFYKKHDFFKIRVFRIGHLKHLFADAFDHAVRPFCLLNLVCGKDAKNIPEFCEL
jgi:hypothetical protein